jgi:hypothetical protein
MNKRDAKILSETITNAQLEAMLKSAAGRIKDWAQVSNVNKGMTLGTSWNILGKFFTPETEYNQLVKQNMLREFGDYLPDNLKPARKRKEPYDWHPVHQKPDLSNYENENKDG